MARTYPREITDQQFSDGVNIAGVRLDRALDDAAARWNAMRPGDIRRGWLASQFVAGFTPENRTWVNGAAVVAPPQHHMPWLVWSNDNATVHSNPTGYPQNPLRHKDSGASGIFYQPDLVNPGQRLAYQGAMWAWTQSWWFSGPVVLDRAFLSLNYDVAGTGHAVRTNTFPNAQTPNAQPIDELACIFQVAVASAQAPEDRSQDALLYCRSHGYAEAFRWRRNMLAPWTTTGSAGSPAWPSAVVEPLNGVAFDDRSLGLAIPAGSRVYVTVLVPQFDNSVVSQGLWGSEPWFGQSYSLACTFLEPLR